MFTLQKRLHYAIAPSYMAGNQKVRMLVKMVKQVSRYSDYIVFMDESGSPTLSPIDPNYPIFVLAFCVINKWTYCDVIQPAIKRLKFEFFGHDMAVLHSSDIRKTKGEFLFLLDPDRRANFMMRLNDIMVNADVDIIVHIVDKTHAFDYSHPRNDPYFISLRSCLQSLRLLMVAKGQNQKLTHLIAESRGKKEDQNLMKEFNTFISDSDMRIEFELLFAEKKANSAGLQLADLSCYPIGRNYLKPDQSNHAFEVIKSKIFDKVSVSPVLKSEKPQISPRPNAD